MTKRSPGLVVAESDLAQDATVDSAVVIRKLDHHLVPWLFTLGILCYLDRTNLSFAALDLNRDLHLSCSTYGLGASLFFISYALFQLPSTAICARLGAHIWLSANIVAWGVVAACFTLASSVPTFLALRFLLGATESAAFPGMWYHLSMFYSEAELGPAYAKVATCTALAQVIGAPLAAAILAMDGAGGLRGWQWLFLLEGLATVVFGVVLRFTLAPSPAKARMLTRAEREWLQNRQDAARSELAAAGRQGSLANGHGQAREGGGGVLQQCRNSLSVLRDWRILYLSFCWLLIAAVMFGMAFFMPLLVSAMFSGGGAISGAGGGSSHGACHSDDDSQAGDKGGGEQQHEQHSSLVALATAIPFMLGAAGMNINARLAGRANERHRHAGIPILMAGLSLGLVPLAARAVGPPFAFVLLSAAVGFCWSFHGPFFSWPAVFLSGEQAAAGFALINSLGAVGGFIGPYLLGLLSDRSGGGFGTAVMVLAVFLLVSGTCILLFPAPGHREEQAMVAATLSSMKPSGSSEYSLAATTEQSASQRLQEEGEGDEGEEDDMESQRSSLYQRQHQHQQNRHARQKSGSAASQLSELECQPILAAEGARQP